MHYCFAYQYDDLGSYLISKGADDSLLNYFGWSCYDGLRPDDQEEALRLLKSTLGPNADLDLISANYNKRSIVIVDTQRSDLMSDR